MKKILLLLLLVFGVITVSGCSLEPGEGLPTWYTYSWQEKEKVGDNFKVIDAGTLYSHEGDEMITSSKDIFDSLGYGASIKGYQYDKKKIVLPDYTNHFKGIDKFGIKFKEENKYGPIKVDKNGLKSVRFDLWLSSDWRGFNFDRYRGHFENEKPFLNWTVYLRKYFQVSTSDVNEVVVYSKNFSIDFSKRQYIGEKLGYLTTIDISTGNDSYIISSVESDVRSKLIDMVIEIRPFEYTKPYNETDYHNNDNVLVPMPLLKGEDDSDLAKLNKRNLENPYLAIKNLDKQITNLRFYWR